MRSSFDFFHPEEVPFARRVHSRGLRLDKAAVLHYARLRGKDGRWIGCECCFTVVYNVLVACISLYRRGTRSERTCEVNFIKFNRLKLTCEFRESKGCPPYPEDLLLLAS